MAGCCAALEDKKWEQRATLEALQLQQAVMTAEEELRRQKCKAQSQVQRIAWTIQVPPPVLASVASFSFRFVSEEFARAGCRESAQPFRERRGRSLPGAYLGPGPLPAAATTSLAHSAEREVSRHYYWDAHGRRHRCASQHDLPVVADLAAFDVDAFSTKW